MPCKHLLARAYRLEVDKVAVMVIAEWFLDNLEPFLEAP
jgi:chorismate-pyruvate lyase